MSEDVLALAAELRGRTEAFALATVVRCERPTSAKPGAKAIIRPDGTVSGWVGGACAEPVVVREAQQAMRDGKPRLIALVGEGSGVPGRAEGLVPYTMTCHSGGTLEIYVEPFLPKPLLVLVGHGPVVDTLAALGRATEFAVTIVAPDAVGEELAPLGLGRDTSVVVATHGNADESALERVLGAEVGYVSLIASRKRTLAVIENLRARRVPEDRIGRLKAPAGLDIGAVTPEEIAVSILAEIIQVRRAGKPVSEDGDPHPTVSPMAQSKDPVCGMLVDVATAPHRVEAQGRVVYFCCAGCKVAFERDPARYAVPAERS
ncbi:MAG TPA: XdhC family protein [Candidatus Methylomirabilis sp.]|nr:XdhC family protein [Candidatus Methylomirabilis sp.]